MNFVSKLSLEKMCLIKTIVSLWKALESNVHLLIFNYVDVTDIFLSDEWKREENKVAEIIKRLQIPVVLERKLLRIMRPVVLQKFIWLLENDIFYKLWPSIHRRICYKSNGVVDYKKTALHIVKDKNIPVGVRYRFACSYCWPHYAFPLWNRLDPKGFYMLDLEQIKYYEYPLVYFWSFYFSKLMQPGESVNFRDFIIVGFNASVSSDQLEAAKYFYYKMNENERLNAFNEIVGERCPEYGFPHVLCKIVSFLFFKLEKGEQHQALQKCFHFLMDVVCDWPYQYLLEEIIISNVNFFNATNTNTYYFLAKLAAHIAHGLLDRTYQKVLIEIWKKKSLLSDVKNLVIKQLTHTDPFKLLLYLLLSESLQVLQVIIDTMDKNEKKLLFYSENGKKVCAYLISKNKPELLKVFASTCEIPCKKAKRFFKKISKFLERKHDLPTTHREWMNKWYSLLKLF